MTHPASRAARTSMKTLPVRQIDTSGEAPSERGFPNPRMARSAIPAREKFLHRAVIVAALRQTGIRKSPLRSAHLLSLRCPTGRRGNRPASIALRAALRELRAVVKKQRACWVFSNFQQMLLRWACGAWHVLTPMPRHSHKMVYSVTQRFILEAMRVILAPKSVILEERWIVLGQKQMAWADWCLVLGGG